MEYILMWSSKQGLCTLVCINTDVTELVKLHSINHGTNQIFQLSLSQVENGSFSCKAR